MFLRFILLPFCINIIYLLFTGVIPQASCIFCSKGWTSMFVILILLLLGIGVWSCVFLNQRDTLKEKLGYEFHASDTRFTVKFCITYGICIFLVGFLASFLGFGAYIPLLISIGKHPLVSNATGMYFVLLNSFMT